MEKNSFATIAFALLIFGVGVIVGNLTATKDDIVTKTTTAIKDVVTNPTASDASTETPITPVAADQAAVTDRNAVAFMVNIENIPDAQRVFLRTMGIDGNEIPVTNSMLACAEAGVGSARIAEIQNGAVPTMSEGFKLVGCYE
jgi:hypothetical protein